MDSCEDKSRHVNPLCFAIARDGFMTCFRVLCIYIHELSLHIASTNAMNPYAVMYPGGGRQ